MKKNSLQTLLLLFVLGATCQAQVTMTQSVFPRLNTFTDSVHVPVPSGISLPTEGAAQTWDYSSLTLDHVTIYNPHTDATSDPSFPNATGKISTTLNFQGFPISGRRYETVDNNGWFYYGRSIDPVTYSISSITGGANDSLHFVDYDDVFSGRTDLLQFPATYQDQWNQSRIETLPFELTVAAFGLNKTPGSRKKHTYRNQTVVGYGTLVMPQANGSPSAPMDVILTKTQRTVVDSFFLGGSPAPPTLLAAFGVTQGQTYMDSFYNFYAPNFGANVLGMIDDNGQATTTFYRPQAVDAVLSVANIQVNATSRSFPNPVRQAQTLTIQTNQTIGAANLTVVDVNGRVVFEGNTKTVSDKNHQWTLTNNLTNGIYFYRLENNATKQVTQGKFQVVD